MGYISSIKSYTEKATSTQGNILERSGNALLSPLRFVFTEYKHSRNCVKKVALLVAGSGALAIGLVGALFKSLGSCCFSEPLKKKKISTSKKSSHSKSTKRSKKSKHPKTASSFFGGSLKLYSTCKKKNVSRLEKKEKTLAQAQKSRERYSTLRMSAGNHSDLMESASTLLTLPVIYQRITEAEQVINKLNKKIEAYLNATDSNLTEEQIAALRSFVQESPRFIKITQEGLKALNFDTIGDQDIVASALGNVVSWGAQTISSTFGNPSSTPSTMTVLEFAEAIDAFLEATAERSKTINSALKSTSKKSHRLNKQVESQVLDIGNRTIELMELLHPGLKNALLATSKRTEENPTEGLEFQLLSNT